MSRKKHGCLGRLVRFVIGCVLIVVAVVAVTNIVTIVSTQDNILTEEEADATNADAILILGASVQPDGSPSPVLQDRLDEGIRLYKQGVAPKIIMSGDNLTASYNEVRAMKAYALDAGVPSEDIFCDHAGISTYDSMYRAARVFGADTVVVVTQNYHLYRALFAGNCLGMKTYGVSSSLRSYSSQDNADIREIFARTKDFFQAVTQMPATYSEGHISLDQNGDVTES
ncbi:MAG: SanA/YdcF family protein [Eggerthellaceae bacterium]